MGGFRADFASGMRDIAPLLIGVVPIGVIFGATAIRFGLTPLQATVMTSLAYAGASQLIAIELIDQQTQFVIVTGTAIIVNLRFMMLSAGIAPYLREYSLRTRAAFAFLLTTPTYLLSVTQFQSDRPRGVAAYYLGLGVPLYACWVAACVAGVFLGDVVPDDLQLQFAIPLMFLALLFSAHEDAATAACAVAASIAATALTSVPFNLGLIIATVVGIGAGLATEGRLG